MNQNGAREQEVASLRRLASLVVSRRVLLILFSLSLVVAIPAMVEVIGIADPSTRRIWLCVMGGTPGSCIFALLSAAGRISHGWEFSQGDKYPAAEPQDKFVARTVPFFMVRPFLRHLLRSFAPCSTPSSAPEVRAV
jgi:hypothetical protein